MGLMDPFRRAVGMPTTNEIQEARLDRDRLSRSADARDVFAAAAADRLVEMPHGQASRTLHAVADEQWPSDPDLRWQAASRAALRFANETVDRPIQNMDAKLGDAVAGRALSDVAKAIAAPTQIRNLDGMVMGRVETVRDQVLSFMSYGRAAEHNAEQQATALATTPDRVMADRLRRDVAEFGVPDSPDRATWLLEASRKRLAMAQSGLLKPERTVQAAIDASQLGKPIQGALAPYDRRLAGLADLKGRRDILADMERRTVQAAYGAEGRPGPPRPRTVIEEPLQLTPEQQKAHAAMLMAAELKRSQAVDSPQAILTGGQPGSGKSYIVRSVGVQFEGRGGVVVIDPDAIRPTLPYMAERILAGNLDIPDAANTDAGTIAYQMIQIAKLEHRNVIVDGTLQNTKRAVDLADELRAADYKVDFHGMAVNPDLSHARTYSRREEQIAESPTGFGRGVSDEFHDQAVKGYGITVETFQKQASVNSLTFYDSKNEKIAETKLVDGQWVPAVSMKDALEEVHQRPSPAVLQDASRTWTWASEAMKARYAAPEEQAKIAAFQKAALARERTAHSAAPSQSALTQAAIAARSAAQSR